MMVNWGTKSGFSSVQEYKGGYPWAKEFNIDTRRLAAGMNMYMAKFALRAPAMPPKMRNLETGSEVPTLYRGLMVDEDILHYANQKGVWPNEGYAAFSRSKNTALMYGTGLMTLSAAPGRNPVIVLLRLRATDVRRGTPWVWFTGDDDMARNKTVLRGIKSNQEVLLPPGRMVFKDPPRTSTYEYQLGGRTFKKKVYTYNISYEPTASTNTAWVALKAAMKFKARGAAGARKAAAK